MEIKIMNDNSEIRGPSITGTTIIGFALGAVVGAGLALLLAPESGKKTRQRLASTAQRWSDSAGSSFDQVREAAAELGADAKSAVKAGQESFLNDRAARESRSDRRMATVGDAAPGVASVKRPGDEPAF
jgi:gas vesicle protein